MKYCFIINPASGKAETKEGLENRIADACQSKGVEYEVLYTKASGDVGQYISELCAKYPSEELYIYACGGDGTLCEGVNGVMALGEGHKVSLGVIPVGTGNDFVRNFSNNSCFFDIEAQIDAQTMEIDLLKCNDIYAINMINIGFDCQVVVKTGAFKRKKFIPSKMAYICGLIATLVKKPGVDMTISVDGAQAEKRELLLTTFANGAFCGGGFHSNPYSKLSDGMIDMMMVNNISRTRFLKLVGSYKKGTHISPENQDILSSAKARRLDMTFERPVEISVDGEIVTVDKIELSCARSALRFLIPKGSVPIQIDADKDTAFATV